MHMRKRVIKKIQKEFYGFKRRLIRKGSKTEIFDNCLKINFCCCLKEYFELNKEIPFVYLQTAYHINGFLELAWRYFLKYEELRYETWEEIDRLMKCMADHEWALVITGEERRHMMD